MRVSVLVALGADVEDPIVERLRLREGVVGRDHAIEGIAPDGDPRDRREAVFGGVNWEPRLAAGLDGGQDGGMAVLADWEPHAVDVREVIGLAAEAGWG